MGSSIALIIHSLDPTRVVLECHEHLPNEPFSGLFPKRIWEVSCAGAVRNRTYRVGGTNLSLV